MRKILVSNDDGIKAPGIRALVQYLSHIAQVYVVAPSDQRSCTSQAMSLHRPVTIEPAVMEGAVRAYTCSGTPADCVKFGLQKASESGITIDFVISGINLGANGGTDIHYSGTVGAAMEAALSGVRAISLSVASHEAREFEFILGMIPELLERSSEFGPEVVLNANAPNLPAWKIKGVKLVPCGPRSFTDKFVQTGNEDEYMYHGTLKDFTGADTDLDLGAIYNGYATITPLRTDFTDDDAMLRLRRMQEDSVICLMMNYQDKVVPKMWNAASTIRHASKLAGCVRAMELPVIVAQHYTRGTGGTVSVVRRPLREFDHVETISFDLFDAPGFERRMKSAAGSTIVIAGLESHISVQQTARSFIRRGYRVVILRDCCSSKDEGDHQTAMELLASEGCTVTTYEAFIYDLLRSTESAHFEEVSAIVNSEEETEEEKAYYRSLEPQRGTDQSSSDSEVRSSAEAGDQSGRPAAADYDRPADADVPAESDAEDQQHDISPQDEKTHAAADDQNVSDDMDEAAGLILPPGGKIADLWRSEWEHSANAAEESEETADNPAEAEAAAAEAGPEAAQPETLDEAEQRRNDAEIQPESIEKKRDFFDVPDEEDPDDVEPAERIVPARFGSD